MQGQTQQDGPGVEGYENICNGKPTNVFQGIAPIVWVGTGTASSTATEPTEPTQTDTNQSNTEEYEQCIQNINAQL